MYDMKLNDIVTEHLAIIGIAKQRVASDNRKDRAIQWRCKISKNKLLAETRQNVKTALEMERNRQMHRRMAVQHYSKYSSPPTVTDANGMHYNYKEAGSTASSGLREMMLPNCISKLKSIAIEHYFCKMINQKESWDYLNSWAQIYSQTHRCDRDFRLGNTATPNASRPFFFSQLNSHTHVVGCMTVAQHMII
ncbi:hypothetical protein O3P69_014834 [Scylla paramamosain]|uniref:Uncharacterized protein n=1 Tax=Scylla paramamosain TaxID=85552 RepID=A0AAW0TZI2_SCYPA